MEGRVPFVQVLGPMSWSSNSFILSYFSPLCLFALHSGIPSLLSSNLSVEGFCFRSHMFNFPALFCSLDVLLK